MSNPLKKDLELLNELQDLNFQIINFEKKIGEINDIIDFLNKKNLACDDVIEEINRVNVENKISFDNIKNIAKEHNLNSEDFLTDNDDVNVCIEKIEDFKKKITTKIQDYNNTLDSLKKEYLSIVKSVTTKKGGITMIIKPEILKIYNRLFKLFEDKTVMAHIEHNTCSYCNLKVCPQKYIDVIKYENIIYCEHCGRIFC